MSPTTPSDGPLDTRSLARSAGWVTGSHLLAQGIAYASLILLARWLSPTSFGTLAVGTAVVYVAVLFVDQGTLGSIIVRRDLTPADLARAARRCWWTACGLGAAMAATAGVMVDNFASGGDAAALAALALCLPLHAIAVVPTAMMQKSMRFRQLAGVNAAANVVSAGAAVLAAVVGWGVWSLVVRQVVLFGIQSVVTPMLYRRSLRAPSALATAPAEPDERSPGTERWFLVLGVALLITSNLDYLVIGAWGDARVVGLYALAFTIALAPSTHVSEQVGRVLFAAAALQPQSGRERVEQSVRLMSMLFLPMLPVGIALAPVLLPVVLGDRWEPMVAPFQLLLVTGIGYAVVNCVGEELSGNGNIAFRARAMLVRCAATFAALLVFVNVDGIRGAAVAHVIVFVPYAAVFFTVGARLAGTSGVSLARSVRPVALALAAQLTVGGGVAVGLDRLDASEAVTWSVAVVVGVIVYVPAVYWLAFRRSAR